MFFSLIANATFLQTEQNEALLGDGQQSIDSCVNIVILTVFEFLVDCSYTPFNQSYLTLSS